MPKTKQGSPQKPDASHIAIIKAVKGPLGFFVLVVLLIEVMLGIVASLSDGGDRRLLIWGMLALVFILIVIVTVLAIARPESLHGQRPNPLVAEAYSTESPRTAIRTMLRRARVEADVKLIRVGADIKAEQRLRRAEYRRREEDLIEQQNLEAIFALAKPLLPDGAAADRVDDDWLANLWDKARLVSNEQMQTVWARVLASEVNKPGTFSRRTVNAITDLDRYDCEIFTRLCRFCWWIVGDEVPLIFMNTMNNVTVIDPIYTDHGVNFDSIKHLEDIGLVSFQRSDGTFGKLVDERPAMMMYFGERFLLDVQESHPLRLSIGSVMLTTIGKELAPIAGAEPLPAFRDFVLRRWATTIKPHSAL